MNRTMGHVAFQSLFLFFRRMENAFEKEYVNGDLTGEQVLNGKSVLS